MCASTLWPFSSSTRNIAFGNGSTTVPSTRIVSSLGLATGHHRGLRARARHAEVLRGDPGGYIRSGPEGNPGNGAAGTWDQTGQGPRTLDTGRVWRASTGVPARIP